jgi:hypothetical protein
MKGRDPTNAFDLPPEGFLVASHAADPYAGVNRDSFTRTA